MSESLIIPNSSSRADVYEAIIPQIESIVSQEENLIANLANITAILKEAFNFFWIGFYLVDTPDELVLAPFQGPLACTRIKRGRGVCGKVFATGVTEVVSDVEQFPGHIACSSLSKSEIVVPIFNSNGEIKAVLDIDSDELNTFDSVDKRYLEEVATIITSLIR